MDNTLVDRIDRLLPQTQCRRCGYAACRPYAEALAARAAAIDRCPPGGQAGVAALAALLEVAPRALDPAYGSESPLRVARVDEAACIGCTLCIQACPVDAIVGAPKLMHTVVAQWCSGCDLCIAPCPVDCIEMVDAGRAWTRTDADAARARFDARSQRLAREPGERTQPPAADGSAEPALRAAAPNPGPSEPERKRAAIEAALQRARSRRPTAPAPAGAPGSR